MLDRVVSVEPGREAKGLKAVSATDCSASGSSPTAPALAGALILHGLCALAEVLLEASDGSRPVLEGLEEATFARSVGPGEILTYRVALLDKASGGAFLEAEATVGAEPVARARLRYRRAREPVSSLEESWRELRQLLRSGEDPPIVR